MAQLTSFVLLLLPALCGLARGSAFVGFNYGAQLSAPPPAQEVVRLLRMQGITHVRLYDANASVLAAMAGSGVEVMVSVPNNQILSVGQSRGAALNWVKSNVMAYLPTTNITAISVGTEVLTTYPNAALVLLPAMTNLHLALVASRAETQVKVSTPHSTSIILDSFPPSQAYFNKTLTTFLLPMLRFLSATGSYFMLDVNVYDIYKQNKGTILLDYALMNPLPAKQLVVDSNNLLSYSSLFDALVDAAYFAMAALNYTAIPLVVAETGWPSKGDPATDTDATPDNAATYNSNLIRHVVSTAGTPRFPRRPVNTYVLELFNEDLKLGPPTARSYGLFNSSTLGPVYRLHLQGSGALLANDTTNQLYCVASPGVDGDALQLALSWACGAGRADCAALQPGKLCYEPDTVAAHASYAFNSYYQQNRGTDQDSCDFGGAAIVTTTNPSYGACIYSGSSNVTLLANSTTVTANSSNTTSVEASGGGVGGGVLCSYTLFTALLLSQFLALGASL